MCQTGSAGRQTSGAGRSTQRFIATKRDRRTSLASSSSTQQLSAEFRTRWATHNLRLPYAGAEEFVHPDVGRMELNYHSMDASAQRDRTLVATVHTAEPGTDSADRLKLLASWAATRWAGQSL